MKIKYYGGIANPSKIFQNFTWVEVEGQSLD